MPREMHTDDIMFYTVSNHTMAVLLPVDVSSYVARHGVVQKQTDNTSEQSHGQSNRYSSRLCFSADNCLSPKIVGKRPPCDPLTPPASQYFVHNVFF